MTSIRITHEVIPGSSRCRAEEIHAARCGRSVLALAVDDLTASPPVVPLSQESTGCGSSVENMLVMATIRRGAVLYSAIEIPARARRIAAGGVCEPKISTGHYRASTPSVDRCRNRAERGQIALELYATRAGVVDRLLHDLGGFWTCAVRRRTPDPGRTAGSRASNWGVTPSTVLPAEGVSRSLGRPRGARTRPSDDERE